MAAGRSSRPRSARAQACPHPDPTLLTHVWRALPGRPPARPQAAPSRQPRGTVPSTMCWEPWPDYLECVWAAASALRHRTPCQSSSELRGLLPVQAHLGSGTSAERSKCPFQGPWLSTVFLVSENKQNSGCGEEQSSNAAAGWKCFQTTVSPLKTKPFLLLFEAVSLSSLR